MLVNAEKAGVLLALVYRVLMMVLAVVATVALVYLAIDVHSLVVDMRSPFEAPWVNMVR